MRARATARPDDARAGTALPTAPATAAPLERNPLMRDHAGAEPEKPVPVTWWSRLASVASILFGAPWKRWVLALAIILIIFAAGGAIVAFVVGALSLLAILFRYLVKRLERDFSDALLQLGWLRDPSAPRTSAAATVTPLRNVALFRWTMRGLVALGYLFIALGQGLGYSLAGVEPSPFIIFCNQVMVFLGFTAFIAFLLDILHVLLWFGSAVHQAGCRRAVQAAGDELFDASYECCVRAGARPPPPFEASPSTAVPIVSSKAPAASGSVANPALVASSSAAGTTATSGTTAMEASSRGSGSAESATPTCSVERARAFPLHPGWVVGKSMTMWLVALILTIVSFENAAKDPVVVEFDVTLDGLHPSLDGFRLVQVSDIHVGPTIGKDAVDTLVRLVGSANADLLVVTGDLVDGRPEKLRHTLDSFRDIHPPRGTYFVTGNHEYISGYVNEWIAELASMNITTLRNQRVCVFADPSRKPTEPVRAGPDALPDSATPATDPFFYLAGVDDWTARSRFSQGGHGPDLPAALEGRSFEDVPVVLLAHQPAQIHQAGDLEVDYVLSGHTHQGQLFPVSIGTYFLNPYYAGHYHHSDSTQIYVNRGTNQWGPPARLGSWREITVHILRSPDATPARRLRANREGDRQGA